MVGKVVIYQKKFNKLILIQHVMEIFINDEIIKVKY